METGRFAPSTTGPAHPGTLLAALLCWLDVRVRGARLVLRLEDLDAQRSKPALVTALHQDLAWIGLDFDAVERQSEAGARHAAALDRLAEAGLLYPCSCSRAELRTLGEPAVGGGFRYPGRCRDRALPRSEEGGWRACREPLRVRIPSGRIELRDESGLDLSLDPEAAVGDPVVRRRDGAVAYHLASVVDDRASGVTRVVRGRDLAGATAMQVVLQRLLGLPTPRYRHHLLLLEAHGGKLAKLHGSVGLPELRRAYSAPALCGWLAHAAGLLPEPAALWPRDLVAGFSWQRVRMADRVVHWRGAGLVLGGEREPGSAWSL